MFPSFAAHNLDLSLRDDFVVMRRGVFRCCGITFNSQINLIGEKQRRRRWCDAALIEVACLIFPYGPLTVTSFEQFLLCPSHTL